MSKNALLSSTAAALFLSLSGPALANPLIVSSTADSGEGSLRQALTEAASLDHAAQIVIAAQGDIAVSAPLVYAGNQPLTLFGNGNTVAAADDFTLLTSALGASLTITDLTLRGPGGFDINNRADGDGTSGKGIFIDVADNQTGTVALTLTNVTVADVANHGVHVSDCNLADACGSGGGGAGEGSAASIMVSFTNVTIDNVGNGKFDADGLRVDERGAGDIVASVVNSRFVRVGADGIELDEGQDGDVHASVIASVFDGNGIYCDPAILKAYLPAEDEAEYDDGVAQEGDIPGPITGSPDDGCFEREVDTYDSGFVEAYEFAIDTDDGFDIDEAGPGSLIATMTSSTITGNLDEGADFDEEGPGGITAWFLNTRAEGNVDDGFKNSEADAGDVTGGLIGSEARGNGGKGAVYEQEDGGDIAVLVAHSVATGNDDSDETGVEVVQDDDGTGTLMVIASDIADGFDLESVTLTEK